MEKKDYRIITYGKVPIYSLTEEEVNQIASQMPEGSIAVHHQESAIEVKASCMREFYELFSIMEAKRGGEKN